MMIDKTPSSPFVKVPIPFGHTGFRMRNESEGDGEGFQSSSPFEKGGSP